MKKNKPKKFRKLVKRALMTSAGLEHAAKLYASGWKPHARSKGNKPARAAGIARARRSLAPPRQIEIIGGSILEEADRLVSVDRGNDYGHPRDDYGRTVRAFNALTGHDLTPEQGILFMVCVKLSRQQHKQKRDNLVDAAGYLKCLDIAINDMDRP